MVFFFIFNILAMLLNLALILLIAVLASCEVFKKPLKIGLKG